MCGGGTTVIFNTGAELPTEVEAGEIVELEEVEELTEMVAITVDAIVA